MKRVPGITRQIEGTEWWELTSMPGVNDWRFVCNEEGQVFFKTLADCKQPTEKPKRKYTKRQTNGQQQPTIQES